MASRSIIVLLNFPPSTCSVFTDAAIIEPLFASTSKISPAVARFLLCLDPRCFVEKAPAFDRISTCYYISGLISSKMFPMLNSSSYCAKFSLASDSKCENCDCSSIVCLTLNNSEMKMMLTFGFPIVMSTAATTSSTPRACALDMTTSALFISSFSSRAVSLHLFGSS